MPHIFVSPCCRGRTRRFGNRRFQCVICFSTFRKQKKKRGRKNLKINRRMVSNYLSKKSVSSRVRGSHPETIRRRREQSLDKYLAHSKWEYPPLRGGLIAVVDGMRQVLEGQEYVVYFLLLRPVNSNQAWIMPPILVPGGESAAGWYQALTSINPRLRNRIKAVVCDGHPQLIYSVRMLGFLIQRCHFHLIASVRNYVTTGPLSHNQAFGKLVLVTIKKVITTLKEPDLNELRDLVRLARSSQLRSRLRGLIKNYDDFRIYLKYPKLNLPTTSNTAESLVQIIRDLQYRARGFRTKKSFLKWLNAVCMHKKIIICNGKKSTN